MIAFDWNAKDSTFIIYVNGNKVHRVLPNWGAQHSVSQEWWGTSVTFRLETAKTFAVVEIGVPNRQMTFPFMVWFSGESPTNTTLPSGCSVVNDGRDITISYNTNACFVVRKYVG